MQRTVAGGKASISSSIESSRIPVGEQLLHAPGCARTGVVLGTDQVESNGVNNDPSPLQAEVSGVLAGPSSRVHPHGGGAGGQRRRGEALQEATKLRRVTGGAFGLAPTDVGLELVGEEMASAEVDHVREGGLAA